MQSKTTSGPSLEVIVAVLQASVALTVPRASLIMPKEGLHTKSVILVIVPGEKDGGVTSTIQVTVLVTADVLPQ